MSDPLETAELLAFARTVESKSLSRAAAELGVPRATVSRRLARLEERLGVRLLRRTTRSLALTDAGDALYRHARIVLDAVTRAEESVHQADGVVRGTLRVSLPPITDRGLDGALCEFARRYPEVQLHLHFSTRFVDLIRDGYDVALRAAADLEPGLVARTLARSSLVAVASPGYLAERGTPRTAKDLSDHACLLGFARGELPQTHWPLAGGGKVQVEGSFFSNEVTLLREAAVRGLGIAVVPLLLVGPLVASGALVRVLPGIVEGASRISIVYPEREFVPSHVRAFVDTMVEWAGSAAGKAVVGATSTASPARTRTARPRTRAARPTRTTR